MKKILHVGCGHPDSGAKLPPYFQSRDWRDIRLDIDPALKPDIIGSMLDMAAVADKDMDAVYSAHNIEHVYAHQVPVALNEFYRVLSPAGFLVITCPDLQSVCSLIAQDKLTDPVYNSPAGPVSPLDILYGFGKALEAGHHFMAHKCGFTLKTLTAAVQNAGFKTMAGKRMAGSFALWLVACKSALAEEEIKQLAGAVLPA